MALVLLKGYKLLISPLFTGSCRFLPSCADYAQEAVIVHGAVRGSWLALRRLARCHPFCRGGCDPVPSLEPSVRIGNLGSGGQISRDRRWPSAHNTAQNT